MNYEQELDLHSEEVQEILGTPPKWIVRWGTTLSILLFVVLGWLAWHFKYPEKVEAPITITSSIPPTDVIAQASGYIDELLIDDKDTVQQGDLLGIIRSTTNYEDVMQLEQYLDNFNSEDESANFLEAKPLRGLSLGQNLQRSYSDFIQSYEEYALRTEGSIGRSSESRYRSEIQKIQRSILIEEQRRNETLNRIRNLNVILDDKQDKYVRKQIQLSELEKTSEQIEDVRRKLDAYDVSINDKELEIERIKSKISSSVQQRRESNLSSYIGLNQSVEQLKSQIDAWKQDYVLDAPYSGIVTYFGSNTSVNKYITTGSTIMSILPLDTLMQSGENEIVGRVDLPIEGSGKIKKGQKVKIRLDSYPAHEYGIVEGVVIQKSILPRNGIYAIDVHLPNKLETKFSKEIQFEQQMSGAATIITQDKRFAERIFEKFFEIFNLERES
ncbi:MAG: HlyD family efflux transporter periplasmic adaptor subunit [Bacteroidota bacterium]